MVAKDMRAQLRNSFKYNNFIVLGSKTADGRAFVCTIIVAASKLKVTDATGFNPLSKDAEDTSSDEIKVLEEDIEAMKDEHNNGVDRIFPFGPPCTPNGVEVPTFVTCSKNGSITRQLLTKMVSKMDDLDLPERREGVNCPMHLVTVKLKLIVRS
jgi:hypothetical protein